MMVPVVISTESYRPLWTDSAIVPRQGNDSFHNPPMSESTNVSPPDAFRLQGKQLRRTCNLAGLGFERSDQLPAGQPHLGQQRATDAMRFAMEMTDDGYNVTVLGPRGSHRHGLAQALARDAAVSKPPPADWCYVNNFSDPEHPHVLNFPAGRGRKFRDDMRRLIEELRLALPAAFEGEEYRNQLKAIEAAMEAELEEQQKSLEELAAKKGIGVMRTPTGYVLAPISNGKVIDEKEFAKLPAARRDEIQDAIRQLSERLQAQIEQMPQLRKRHREKVRELNREVTSHAAGVLIAEVKEKYRDLPAVVGFLDEIQRDIIGNAEQFHKPPVSPFPFLAGDSSRLLDRYEVNLVVSNNAESTAPVIYEPNPGYQNLIGKIEHQAEMGTLITDYRFVRAGALLRANGGYLLLDLQRLLTLPFAWEALKQALFAKRVRIESPGEAYGLMSTTTLRPEPIPLNVKIILIAERWLYYLLCAYDSECGELFKVAADLEDELPRSSDNDHAYALLIAERARTSGLLPFDRSAVERAIEQSARKAEDAERLSMHMRFLNDLLSEADYWARHRASEVVEARDLDRAVDENVQRLDRVRTNIMDAIQRNTLLIDTTGSRTGQVNGLSMVELGEFRFGHPVRITATTRMGTGDVVDIEREVELGGAIHSKGVLILSSALSSRYARHVPLSLHASVVFEQSYGGVEGDSASVAELCALLSSLSDVPVLQNFAVTGSVNQLGRIQVVGGINEKIEGFFDVCKTRNLDGTHGVIIPRENVKHLMLRHEVVRAVEEGAFSVYAVQTIDEALSILTAMPAGERDEHGEFPAGSVNLKVEQQLLRYAELRKKFAEDSGHAHG
jgi:lon-related putative ATP-dependent protease